jgi:methionyl-tRNA formyltransferase
MPKIKTLFFCGHESRYGRAHLEPLLKSDVLEVSEIVLASFDRWNQFLALLTGESTRSSLSKRLGFKKRGQSLIRKIKQLKDCQIRFTDDVNIDTEYKNARDYDLAISAAYPQIFKADLIRGPRLGAINFHPSYLPRCRGAHPVYWTIASQEPFGGVSCHIMTERLDAGDIVAQRKIEFDPTSISYFELYQAVEAETPLLCKDVEDYFINHRSPSPQMGLATYFRNEREIHRKIAFGKEGGEQIGAKIRAGRAFAFDRLGRKAVFCPPVSIYQPGSRLTIQTLANLVDGTVIEAQRDQLVIKIGNHLLATHYCLADPDPDRSILSKIARAIDVTVNSQKLAIGEVLS